MQKAFLLMIIAGAGIGFLLPLGDRTDKDKAAAQPGSAEAATSAGPVAGATPHETVLSRSHGGHFYANVEVNGQLVRFLVDTGATGVALAEKDAARIGIPFSRDEFEVVATGASGPVRGKHLSLDSVRLDGKEARNVKGVVIEGGDISLLGQAYLGQYSVEMRGDRMRIY
jgi:aspartyl protease family protein